MTDDGRAKFLARVEEFASGQAARFAPALDELIIWSLANGLEAVPPPARQFLVRYRFKADKALVWTAMPRAGDGAKLTLAVPDHLLDEARAELSRIAARPVDVDKPAEVAFTYLIWGPHRAAVIAMLTKMLPGDSVVAGPAGQG